MVIDVAVEGGLFPLQKTKSYMSYAQGVRGV